MSAFSYMSKLQKHRSSFSHFYKHFLSDCGLLSDGGAINPIKLRLINSECMSPRA